MANLQSGNNLSDVDSVSASRANLGFPATPNRYLRNDGSGASQALTAAQSKRLDDLAFRTFDTVDDLIASTQPAAGDGTIWRVGAHQYIENSLAGTPHFTNAASVKLDVLPYEHGYSSEAFNWKPGLSRAEGDAIFAKMKAALQQGRSQTILIEGGFRHEVDTLGTVAGDKVRVLVSPDSELNFPHQETASAHTNLTFTGDDVEIGGKWTTDVPDPNMGAYDVDGLNYSNVRFGGERPVVANLIWEGCSYVNIIAVKGLTLINVKAKANAFSRKVVDFQTNGVSLQTVPAFAVAYGRTGKPDMLIMSNVHVEEYVEGFQPINIAMVLGTNMSSKDIIDHTVYGTSLNRGSTVIDGGNFLNSRVAVTVTGGSVICSDLNLDIAEEDHSDVTLMRYDGRATQHVIGSRLSKVVSGTTTYLGTILHDHRVTSTTGLLWVRNDNGIVAVPDNAALIDSAGGASVANGANISPNDVWVARYDAEGGLFEIGDSVTCGAGTATVLHVEDRVFTSLPYDGGTVALTIGQEVTGAVTGAKGVVTAQSGTTTSGTLTITPTNSLRFRNDEAISDPLGGAAIVNTPYGAVWLINVNNPANFVNNTAITGGTAGSGMLYGSLKPWKDAIYYARVTCYQSGLHVRDSRQYVVSGCLIRGASASMDIDAVYGTRSEHALVANTRVKQTHETALAGPADWCLRISGGLVTEADGVQFHHIIGCEFDGMIDWQELVGEDLLIPSAGGFGLVQIVGKNGTAYAERVILEDCTLINRGRSGFIHWNYARHGISRNNRLVNLYSPPRTHNIHMEKVLSNCVNLLHEGNVYSNAVHAQNLTLYGLVAAEGATGRVRNLTTEFDFEHALSQYIAHGAPTVAFTVGRVVQGATSGATGTIVAIDTTNNRLYLNKILVGSGGSNFANSETITETTGGAPGSATTLGTLQNAIACFGFASGYKGRRGIICDPQDETEFPATMLSGQSTVRIRSRNIRSYSRLTSPLPRNVAALNLMAASGIGVTSQLDGTAVISSASNAGADSLMETCLL